MLILLQEVKGSSNKSTWPCKVMHNEFKLLESKIQSGLVEGSGPGRSVHAGRRAEEPQVLRLDRTVVLRHQIVFSSGAFDLIYI